MRELQLKPGTPTFNQYLHYSKVRESLKGQFAARMAEGLADAKGQKPATTGAAMGAILGIALIDNTVDALVRPELVAMHEARVQERAGKPDKAARATNPAKKPQAKGAPLEVH